MGEVNPGFLTYTITCSDDMDSEVAAMHLCVQVLEGLMLSVSDSQRKRVAQYLLARYEERSDVNFTRWRRWERR